MSTTDPFGARYQFHSVGQGLFATGDLGPYAHGDWLASGQSPAFSWVYDCGTTSSQKLIDAALDRYGRHPSAPQRLGMVVLSHFDKDHISGVVRLLQRYPVDVLLLPYVPLHHRVLFGLIAGEAADSPTMRFLLDPAGFIRSADTRGVQRIVVVPPSRGEAPGTDEDPDPGPLPDKWELELSGTTGMSDGSNSADPLASETMLATGGSLRLAKLWEFVPYNDATLSHVPSQEFVKLAHAHGLVLLRATSDNDRKAALDSLQAAYDREFGKESKPRNEISLFLYAGPALAKRRFDWRVNFGHGQGRGWVMPPQHTGGAMLYTGDGYMDEPARLTALSAYLGADRIDGVSVLQVMHHGARDNWHDGVADAIRPDLSVFSSDPHHQGFGHPHAEVVRDFWGHGPIQVDAHRDASIHVWPVA